MKGRLEKGIDLEAALSDLNIEEAMLEDIVYFTWKLVNDADLELLDKWIISQEKCSFGKLIAKFYSVNPQCVNIITTNYDRLIEYACDQYGIVVDNGFQGEYIGRLVTGHKPACKKVVNLLKVHGSLDWFYREDGQVISVPLQKTLMEQLKPAIVTPGTMKYERVLGSPFRDILHKADDLIGNAYSFLCIGYGFNDSQIQHNIINEIKSGKPIVVVTKEISKDAEKLITANSSNYIILQEDKRDINHTEILIPTEKVSIEGKYWTQEGFIEMF